MNYFKTFNKKQSGFTLIELLIVVAIIAILSGVVLASLNGARVKAQNSKVISEMSSLRAQAELFYNSNDFKYLTGASDCTSGMFTSTDPNSAKKLFDAISSKATGVSCNVTNQSWAISATLPDGTTTYCVDSTGASKSSSTVVSGSCS